MHTNYKILKILRLKYIKIIFRRRWVIQ